GGLRQPGPPFGSLLLLAPLLVKPSYTFGRLGQARLALPGEFCLADLHALVARGDQRLRLGLLLFAQPAVAAPPAGVEGVPPVGLALLADGQALAQDGLGLGPLALPDEAQAQWRQDTGRAQIGRPEALAEWFQRGPEQRLGLGTAAGLVQEVGQVE